jgi:hypothetical protein
LLDNAVDICGAIQQTLSGHLSKPLPFEYLKRFIGYHLNDCFTEVLPHYTPEQLAALVGGRHFALAYGGQNANETGCHAPSR